VHDRDPASAPIATSSASPGPRATLESVAARARVSRQTVSNVLNSPHVVSETTLHRVRQAIDDLGYRPHLAARQMRTRRSRVIGLRMEHERNGVSGVVFDRFLHAFTEAAQATGYRVMLFTADGAAAEVDAYDELTSSLDLDAFMLTDTHADDPRAAWLMARGLPFVTFGRPWTPPLDHAWVDVDGRAGLMTAVDHLAAQGYRRVGFVGWPGGSDVGDDRRAGWLESLQRNGLDGADLAVEAEDGIATGRAAAAGLLDGPAAPGPGGLDALACASDSLALGALAEITARGLRVGVDVGLVGFDDTAIAPALGLTSVRQPIAEVARVALDLLLTQLDPPAGAAARTQRLLAPELVARASSSRAP
jgi:DNA-binding LacI/PurR family transcriptional regulator